MISHDEIFCHEKFLGVHARLPKCERGTWSEKGWEPLS